MFSNLYRTFVLFLSSAVISIYSRGVKVYEATASDARVNEGFQSNRHENKNPKLNV